MRTQFSFPKQGHFKGQIIKVNAVRRIEEGEYFVVGRVQK